MRETFHIVEDTRACSGKTGDGLEIGVHDSGDAAMYQEGEHPEERKNHPDGSHQQIGVASVQRVLRMSAQHQEEDGTGRCQQHRDEKGHLVVFTIGECHHGTQGHEERLNE